MGEPRELYLIHFSVENGKGVTVGKAIYKEPENTDLQNSWSIVGLDGTAIRIGNTMQHCHFGTVASKIFAMGHMSPAHQQITFQGYL